MEIATLCKMCRLSKVVNRDCNRALSDMSSEVKRRT